MRPCLEAIRKTTPKDRVEVLVVDNASGDGTAALLWTGRDFQFCRVAWMPENLGFARACNEGAKIARGEWLIFLNNDTEVRDGWFEALEEQMAQDVGAIGCKLLYPGGTIQHAGILFERKYFPIHIHRGAPADHSETMKVREFPAVTAACMAVPAVLFDEIDGFEEGYENGYEDIDLCMKIRAANKKIVYTPHCVVLHREAQTPGRFAKEMRNQARFINRWAHILIPGINQEKSDAGWKNSMDVHEMRPFDTDHERPANQPAV